MVVYIGLSILFGWLLFLTVLVFLTRRHYFRLIGPGKKERLDEILESLIQGYGQSQAETKELREQIHGILQESQHYLKKINVVRFNPFERGGEQSFVIALLDKEKNGVIINFMHTPEGLRAFTKKVKNGKGEEHHLSEEEQKAVLTA